MRRKFAATVEKPDYTEPLKIAKLLLLETWPACKNRAKCQVPTVQFKPDIALVVEEVQVGDGDGGDGGGDRGGGHGNNDDDDDRGMKRPKRRKKSQEEVLEQGEKGTRVLEHNRQHHKLG